MSIANVDMMTNTISRIYRIASCLPIFQLPSMLYMSGKGQYRTKAIVVTLAITHCPGLQITIMKEYNVNNITTKRSTEPKF